MSSTVLEGRFKLKGVPLLKNTSQDFAFVLVLSPELWKSKPLWNNTILCIEALISDSGVCFENILCLQHLQVSSG